MEVFHAIGDIFTKMSVNCVLNYMLHYYLCVIFMGFSCVCCMCISIFILYESVHFHSICMF
jgi:hypothetical protein